MNDTHHQDHSPKLPTPFLRTGAAGNALTVCLIAAVLIAAMTMLGNYFFARDRSLIEATIAQIDAGGQIATESLAASQPMAEKAGSEPASRQIIATERATGRKDERGETGRLETASSRNAAAGRSDQSRSGEATRSSDPVARQGSRIVGSATASKSAEAVQSRSPDASIDSRLLDQTTIPSEAIDSSLSISGRVLDQHGEPIGDVQLSATATRLYGEAEGTAVTSALRRLATVSANDGYFEFAPVAAGEYRLQAAASDDYASSSTAVRAGVEYAIVQLRSLRRELSLRGVIRDVHGTPLAGVEVRPHSLQARVGYSDESGRYRAVLALVGKQEDYKVAFKHPDYLQTHARISRGDYQNVTSVRLDAVMEPVDVLASVVGLVQTTDGVPIAAQRINLSSNAVKRKYGAVTDEHGSFVIEQIVPAVDYHIQIFADGPYLDHVEFGVEIPAAGLDLDIVLESKGSGSIFGQMRDPQGRPIPKFSLLLRNRDSIKQVLVVIGDEQGFFQIDQVPQGRLSFETRSTPRFNVHGIALAANQNLRIDPVIDWGDHELHGIVRNSSDEPLAGTQIKLIWSSVNGETTSKSSRNTTADADGEFHFTQLGPGAHTVVISNGGGYLSFSQDYDVSVTDNVVITRLTPAE